MLAPDEQLLIAAIENTLTSHPDTVAAWLRNEPGAWGRLAGQAVLAMRDRLGRSLTEEERRAVWQALWDSLQEHKRGRGTK